MYVDENGATFKATNKSVSQLRRWMDLVDANLLLAKLFACLLPLEYKYIFFCFFLHFPFLLDKNKYCSIYKIVLNYLAEARLVQ